MKHYVTLNLKMENGMFLHFKKDDLQMTEEELFQFLDGQDNMKTLSFAKKMMMSQEIKSNNVIEGIKDDLSIIEEVIRKRKTPISEQERKRIINLYYGYQYILTHQKINKDSLKELYQILSNGILEPADEARMGKYYRTAPVYILKGNRLDVEPFLGVNENDLEEYMNQFFEYVNEDTKEKNEIDIFLKSQIMHFYFVYIHPYFDVNGRTSRTVSMWYLLTHQCYPYIIFNRAISFAKREYEQNIIKGRAYGDITLFLKYMLTQVERELEKEYFIQQIEKKIPLSKEEAQMLDYFLSMKGNFTVKDFASMYNLYNEHRPSYEIYTEKIIPLIDKRVLIPLGYTKSFIQNQEPNFKLGFPSSLLEMDPTKIKHLNVKLQRKI